MSDFASGTTIGYPKTEKSFGSCRRQPVGPMKASARSPLVAKSPKLMTCSPAVLSSGLLIEAVRRDVPVIDDGHVNLPALKVISLNHSTFWCTP